MAVEKTKRAAIFPYVITKLLKTSVFVFKCLTSVSLFAVHFFKGACIPLGCIKIGSLIRGHSDHCASKEPVNPCSGLFTGSFDAQWSEQTRITGLITDHPKGTPQSYFNLINWQLVYHVVLEFLVRLVGGKSSFEGRVEVLYAGIWGNVKRSSSGYTVHDKNSAIVICRQLGFEGGAPETQFKFGRAARNTWMNDLRCSGNERSIIECKHTREDGYYGVLEVRCTPAGKILWKCVS